MERVSAGVGAFVDRKAADYIPRVVIIEHKGSAFKDREIADGHSYPTPEKCIEHGIITARAYIDCGVSLM